MKPGVPVAIGAQPAEVLDVLLAAAERVGAPVLLRDRDWQMAAGRYSDATALSTCRRHRCRARSSSTTPASRSPRCARRGWPMDVAGIAAAEWPARLQRLHGRLAALLPADWELWLDGGHNPGAGIVLAEHLRVVVGSAGASGRRHEAGEGRRRIPAAAAAACHHSCGRWPNRDSTTRGRSRPSSRRRAASRGRVRMWPTRCVRCRATAPARVLICGSLYLAGEVLKQDQ